MDTYWHLECYQTDSSQPKAKRKKNIRDENVAAKIINSMVIDIKSDLLVVCKSQRVIHGGDNKINRKTRDIILEKISQEKNWENKNIAQTFHITRFRFQA